MYTVVQDFSGSGAKDLFDMLEKKKDEVESVIKRVKGVVAITVVRTADGGVSLTACRDRAAAVESLKVAAVGCKPTLRPVQVR
jgi:hypothetical protein